MPTVIGGGDYIYSVRRALIVYFDVEPKIRKLKRPEEIKKVLSNEEWRGYIGALHLLRNSELSGDDLIEILSNGDHSPLRYKSIERILSNYSRRTSKEDI